MTTVLHAPIILGAGATLGPEQFVCAPDFAWTSTPAAIYTTGNPANVTIRGVTLDSGVSSWKPTWNDSIASQPATGVPRQLRGISFNGCTNLDIDGLTVVGFPNAGVELYGCTTVNMHDVFGHRCFVIISFPNSTGYDTGFTIDTIGGRDTWGPGPGVWVGTGGTPSRKRPGGWIGGDACAGYLFDSTLSNLAFGGECYAGIKISRGRNVTIDRLRTNTMSLQGYDNFDGVTFSNADASLGGAHDITITNSTIDKDLAIGELSDLDGNGLQASWGIDDLIITGTTFRSHGHDGMGAQLADDVHGTFEDCIFTGWNGVRGVTPAAAIQISSTSSINADFDTANTFYDQDDLHAPDLP